jgi:hypothetical protein
MRSVPSPVCPLCASGNELDTPVTLPEGGWQFVCRASHGPYVFDLDSDSQVVPYPEDLAADLAICDDLRTLVTNEFQRVEYGIVEHMYGTNHRKKYDKLIGIYGHAATTPSTYTASSFIASVLGRLHVLGDLNSALSLATGYWSENVAVSYWCPGDVEPVPKKTWEAFAVERDIDPMSWPLLGSTRAQRYWNNEFLALAAGDPVDAAKLNAKGWDGRMESLLESVYKVTVNPEGTTQDSER